MPEQLNATETELFDEDGGLRDPSTWNRQLAEAMAAKADVTLTDRHWVVIDYMRKDFEEAGKSPTIRRITKNSGVNTKELYALFPVRPGSTAARIAGVPKPEGCV